MIERCKILERVLFSEMTFRNLLKLLLLMGTVTLQTKKVVCDCGGLVKPKKRNGETAFTAVMVYTREGSTDGRHYEHRQDGFTCDSIARNIIIDFLLISPYH